MIEKQFKVTNISENGNTGLFWLGKDNLSVYDVVRVLNELYDENKELKARCEDYRKLSIQYQQKYDEKISDNTFLEEENTHIKNTIKQAYNNERTTLGKNILKQLMEQIQ